MTYRGPIEAGRLQRAVIALRVAGDQGSDLTVKRHDTLMVEAMTVLAAFEYLQDEIERERVSKQGL